MNKCSIVEIFWGEKNIRECVEKLRPRCWPEETTICYKISLVQWLITNLNLILYLSTCHTVHISVLILFMFIPSLIINTYVSLMYELKKNGNVFRSKSVWTGPSSYEKRIYRARGLTKVEKHCSNVQGMLNAPQYSIFCLVFYQKRT